MLKCEIQTLAHVTAVQTAWVVHPGCGEAQARQLKRACDQACVEKWWAPTGSD